jgi:hypothetical protein
MTLTRADKEASWHILQLAQQGRNIEITAQNLASILWCTSTSVEEFASELAAIIKRVGELTSDSSLVWPGLLPGIPNNLDDMISEPDLEKPYLSLGQWAALVRMEERLYHGEYGAHAYTSIVRREESHDAARMWSIAQNPVDDALDTEYSDPQDIPDRIRDNRIARRVAQSLALLNFGADFLLK